MQEQIVVIFVLGHAVSILLTPFANYAADLYGERVQNIFFTILISFGSVLSIQYISYEQFELAP